VLFQVRIVHHNDDRTPSVAAAVAKFPAGHLERAVPDQHQRSPAGRGLDSKRGGHAEPHRGVVAGSDDLGVLDLESGEHAIAAVARQWHPAATCEQVVHRACDVDRCNRAIVVGPANAKVTSIVMYLI